MDRFRYLSECDFQATISKPYIITDLHHTIGHVYEGTHSRAKFAGKNTEVIFQHHSSISAKWSHVNPIPNMVHLCTLLLNGLSPFHQRNFLFQESSYEFGWKQPNEVSNLMYVLSKAK